MNTPGAVKAEVQAQTWHQLFRLVDTFGEEAGMEPEMGTGWNCCLPWQKGSMKLAT